LDTSAIVDGIVRGGYAKRLLRDFTKEKLTIEYVIKEVRRVLRERFGFSQEEINEQISALKAALRVLPTPSVARFRKFNLSDKSDRPIVCSAADENCILVTTEKRLYREARKYVWTVAPEEIYKKR